jgi:uncharacterized membrane protein (UPF0182 family)
VFLRWRFAEPFGRIDRVFGRDLAFYVFTLPVLARSSSPRPRAWRR